MVHEWDGWGDFLVSIGVGKLYYLMVWILGSTEGWDVWDSDLAFRDNDAVQ